MAEKDKDEKPKPGSKDWTDEFFEAHGITEDEDKSFLKSRALADEFVEESRKRRAPKPAEKKRLFGGRAERD